MTYKGVCIDGDNEVVVEFEDVRRFHIWQQSMAALKQEATCIVAANDDFENLTMENIQAVRNWIRRVDEMVEAGTSVLPSILRARNTFAEDIKDK